MNNLSEFDSMNELLDAYINLLSEAQKEIAIDYFRFNLSISEISENRSITRAAVNDALKKTKTNLINFEEKLNFVGKTKKIKEELLIIKEKTSDAEIFDIIDKIEKDIL